jgi:hypothetical protein
MNPEESLLKFKECNSLEEFLHLWSLFYENKIYIPTYGSKFDKSNKSNKSKNKSENIAKFQKITKAGIICLSSQSVIPGKQKGYITAYALQSSRSKLLEELNRYDGIVALGCEITESNAFTTYVTYENVAVNERRMNGKAVTSVGGGDPSLYYILDRESSQCTQFINAENYFYLTIIAPHYASSPDYCLDILEKSLRVFNF